MSDQLTRQELLKRAAIGGAAITFPGILAACGGSGTSASGGTTSVEHKLASTLNFSNWTLYMDVNKKTKQFPSLDAFEKKTGVHVNYTEDINDNAGFFGKIQGPLSRGQSINRDIIVLTDNDRYLGLMLRKGWAEKLDKSAIPNMKNLVDVQKHPNFDPNRDYTLPWQSGMTGIAWNEDVTGPVTSVQQLLEDPKLKGKVTMLMEMADSVGLVILQNGDDPKSVSDETFDKAISTVQKAVDSGQIRRFTGNDYAQPLTKGDIAAAVAWSGDVVQLLASNPKLKWGIPESGGMIWTDNMLIPKDGSAATASTYMNFAYDPVVAAKIAAYVNYVTPVKGAREELAKTDPDTAKNTLIFPTDDMLSKVNQFDATALKNEDFIQKWQTVLGA
jgi:spermidine/putrescine transport system substrate-binding protein